MWILNLVLLIKRKSLHTKSSGLDKEDHYDLIRKFFSIIRSCMVTDVYILVLPGAALCVKLKYIHYFIPLNLS